MLVIEESSTEERLLITEKTLKKNPSTSTETKPKTIVGYCFAYPAESEKMINELKSKCYQYAEKEKNNTVNVKVLWDEDGPGLDLGKTFDRKVWKDLKDTLQKGDQVVVLSLASFSKATLRITLNEIESLQNRGIEFHVGDLKTDSPWDYVLKFYEYFEGIRLERQNAGIAAIINIPELKKEKYPGRKTVLDSLFLEQLQDLRVNQKITSPTELSRKLERSRSTIYKALKVLEEAIKVLEEQRSRADGET